METIPALGLKTSYDIEWIDDCTYTLSNQKVLEGKIDPDLEGNDVIKVEILSVTDDYYTIKATSNLNTHALHTKVQRKW